MTMKIGIAGNILQKNKRGFENYLRGILSRFSYIDDDFHIFLYTDTSVPEFENEPKITIRVIPRSLKTFFWRNLKLPIYVFRDKVDIFHFPDNSIWLFSWKPTIVTLHDISPLLFSDLRITARWMLWIIRVVYFFIRLNARYIITDSHTSKKDIINNLIISKDKIANIPLGYKKFSLSGNKDVSFEIFKKKYNLSDKFVLFVGGVDRRKNVVKLIQAMKIVRQHHFEDIQLVIAGIRKGSGGLQYTPLTKLLYDAEVIKFTSILGFIDDNDLDRIYQMASVFVLPSLYEGFGLTVLEAMSSNTPVIVSDSEWGREITGGNALFVDPYNEQDIACAIINVLSDTELANNLIAGGKNNIKKFSWDETVRQTLEIYKKVVP